MKTKRCRRVLISLLSLTVFFSTVSMSFADGIDQASSQEPEMEQPEIENLLQKNMDVEESAKNVLKQEAEIENTEENQQAEKSTAPGTAVPNITNDEKQVRKVEAKENVKAAGELEDAKTKAKERLNNIFAIYAEDSKEVSNKLKKSIAAVDAASTVQEVDQIVKDGENYIFTIGKKDLLDLIKTGKEDLEELKPELSADEYNELLRQILQLEQEVINTQSLQELEQIAFQLLKNIIQTTFDGIADDLKEYKGEFTQKQYNEITDALSYIEEQISAMTDMDDLRKIGDIIDNALSMLSQDTLDALDALLMKLIDYEEESEKEVKKERPKQESDDSPQTGDPMSIGLLLALMGTSGAGLVVFRRKK